MRLHLEPSHALKRCIAGREPGVEEEVDILLPLCYFASILPSWRRCVIVRTRDREQPGVIGREVGEEWPSRTGRGREDSAETSLSFRTEDGSHVDVQVIQSSAEDLSLLKYFLNELGRFLDANVAAMPLGLFKM